MKIAVCEDQVVQINLLNAQIKNWAKENNINISIDNFSTAESFLFKWSEYDRVMNKFNCSGLFALILGIKEIMTYNTIQWDKFVNDMIVLSDNYDSLYFDKLVFPNNWIDILKNKIEIKKTHTGPLLKITRVVSTVKHIICKTKQNSNNFIKILLYKILQNIYNS